MFAKDYKSPPFSWPCAGFRSVPSFEKPSLVYPSPQNDLIAYLQICAEEAHRSCSSLSRTLFLELPSLPQSVSQSSMFLSLVSASLALQMVLCWSLTKGLRSVWPNTDTSHKPHHINFSCLHCLQSDLILTLRALNVQG